MLGSPPGPLFRVMAGIAIGGVFLLVVLFIQSRMVTDLRGVPFAGVVIFVALRGGRTDRSSCHSRWWRSSPLRSPRSMARWKSRSSGGRSTTR